LVGDDLPSETACAILEIGPLIYDSN